MENHLKFFQIFFKAQAAFEFATKMNKLAHILIFWHSDTWNTAIKAVKL